MGHHKPLKSTFPTLAQLTITLGGYIREHHLGSYIINYLREKN